MNKKISYLISLGILLLPAMAFASTLGTYAEKVKIAAIDLAGAIVVIGWVVAGILYLTAAGAPEKLGVAKKALVACIIGTMLVVLAMTSDAIVSLIKDTLGVGGGGGGGANPPANP